MQINKIFKDTFFSFYRALVADQYLFLESYFVSLDKSASLHLRRLMSKFTEMSTLVCRKYFVLFILLYMSFSNSYGFALLQEFNIFYPHLILYDRKQMFFRSSCPEMFYKKAALRDFSKCKKNTCVRVSLLLKLQAKVGNFI